jgi:hypothetical protein
MEDNPKGGIQRLVGIAVLCSARKYRDVVGVCLFVLAEFGETRLTAPVLLGFPLHRGRVRVLDLDPVRRPAGTIRASQRRFDTMPSQPSAQAWR